MPISKAEYLEFLAGAVRDLHDTGDIPWDQTAAALTLVRQTIEPFGLQASVGILEMVKLTLLIEDLPEGFWPKPTT